MHLFNYLQNINCWFYYFTFRFDPHRRRSVSSSAESSCQTIILLQKQMKIQIILSFFGLRGASERRLKLVWVKCITILTVRTTYLFYKWVSEFFISPESEWGEFQWGGELTRLIWFVLQWCYCVMWISIRGRCPTLLQTMLTPLQLIHFQAVPCLRRNS